MGNNVDQFRIEAVAKAMCLADGRAPDAIVVAMADDEAAAVYGDDPADGGPLAPRWQQYSRKARLFLAAFGAISTSA